MKSVLSVKMLAALALVLLVSSAVEGRILSKCELKAQLDAAQFQQITAMGEKITMDNLIARLVCKANSSAFNTSFVKAIMVNNKEMKPAQAPPQAPPQAPAKAPSRVPPQTPPQAPPQAPSKIPPKPHAQAPTKGPQVPDHKTKHPKLNATAKVSGQLYGVFQLSDQLACDSGMMPSLNVCNMSCSALIDDDITNDIACLKTLMNTMKPKPIEKPTDGNKILEELMVKECRSVVPAKYFADCA
ncbi:uncharacterized protein LOC125271408 isoform X2 [Megalobrama amblycephala]|nr:uncharacterized protein LOC125271408 isoform X2 [Megalobrama amblycephala]